MEIYELIYIIQNKNKAFLKKSFLCSKKIADISASDFFSDPRGVRTHDPILKRDVLYQLS